MAIYHKTIPCMNSSLDIVIPEIDTFVAEQLGDAIQQQTYGLENLLSCYKPEAEAFQVNNKAYQGEIPVSDHFYEIIEACFRYHEMTVGYFDVGLGNVKAILQQQNISDAGMKNILLNIGEKTIKFTSNTVALDFGAIGKGLVLKKVDEIFTSYNIKNCFVSFGGSSILTKGSHPFGPSWPVTFRDFSGKNYMFCLNNHCASFSGALFEDTDNNSYHIINPKSLKVEENNRLVFVQCYCPVEAEVLSTTLVLTSLEESKSVLARFNPVKALIFNKNPDREMSIIFKYEQTN